MVASGLLSMLHWERRGIGQVRQVRLLTLCNLLALYPPNRTYVGFGLENHVSLYDFRLSPCCENCAELCCTVGIGFLLLYIPEGHNCPSLSAYCSGIGLICRRICFHLSLFRLCLAFCVFCLMLTRVFDDHSPSLDWVS